MMTTIVMLAGALAAGQLPAGTNPRVAVDRNNQYVDTVFEVGSTNMVGWKRNGGSVVSFAGGYAPSNDVDDNGNSAVVWIAPDPGNQNALTVYLRINASAPIAVDVGGYARVAMGRTNGKIAVAYIDAGGSYIGGHGINATSIRVKTYNLSGSVTSGPTLVNTVYAGYAANCNFGGISAAENGDYVVAFYRLSGPSGTTGVFAKGYLAGTATAKFGETQVYNLSGASGQTYFYAEISCYSSGHSVIAYNGLTGSGQANSGAPLYTTLLGPTGAVGVTQTVLPFATSYRVTGYKKGSSSAGIVPFSVAARRNSSGHNDYVLVWQSDLNSGTAAWDLYYLEVHNGVLPSIPVNATNGSGGLAPDAFSTPCAALADASSGGVDAIFAFQQWVGGVGWNINWYTFLF